MPDSAGPAPLMIDVLLVDDHELVRTGVRGLLERHGEPAGIHVVGEAASGEEALEVLPRLRPDVILMDLNMPGLGGLETTRRVLASVPRFVRTQALPPAVVFNVKVTRRQSPRNITRDEPGSGVCVTLSIELLKIGNYFIQLGFCPEAVTH